MRALQDDLETGVFSQADVVWADVFLRAERFSASHGTATLCRSLDTLQVALASVLGATEFCTFDARQAKMAAAVGFTILP